MTARHRNTSLDRPQAILVATDYSAAAARARDCALALASSDARITFIHVHPMSLPEWPEPAYVPDWMPAETSVSESALDRLRQFAAPAAAAGRTVDVILQEGLPADVILAAAEEMRADLIAMGTQGRHGLERMLLGSTADRVMRLARSPVLMLSEHAAATGPRVRHVLCAIDLEDHSRDTFALARELAGRCGSTLSVLHVVAGDRSNDPERKRWARQELAAAIEGGPAFAAAELRVRTGRPWREILQAASESAVDVIVMGLHDRGFPCTTAAHVVREASCGVVTVRHAAIARACEDMGRDETLALAIG
jgi:nucleotide-binding universal stress UspA family protein